MSVFSVLFGGNKNNELVVNTVRNELSDKMDALSRIQATIEFEMDGTIITANDNFLNVVGYQLTEIEGKHHSMFVPVDIRNSNEYRDFWRTLGLGDPVSGEFQRLSKSGDDVWLNASYSPVLDEDGKPYKVIKFATDITDSKLKSADYSGQISAIRRSQAVIEFNMDGTIIDANENFLLTLGYSLDEIKGKHHRMFVDTEYAKGSEYKAFWGELNEGGFFSNEYLRLGKGGKQIWIQASYNPIFDLKGKPMKVVKYATDITEQKLKEVESKRLADQTGALKICQTNVMMADMDCNIVYMNDSVGHMFRKNESELNSSLGNFKVDRLLGANIDIFHKNPSHQRSMLSSLSTVYKTDIQVAKLHFGLVATPWMSLDGERIGTIVEWTDKTAEVNAEKDVQALVDSAVAGDFTRQLETEGRSGFILSLAQGLNSLVSTTETSLNDVNRMLGAMARGDLSERITRDYQGSFAQLKDDANSTADKLTEVLGKIRSASGSILSAANEISAGNADLSQRTEEQASALEETASSMEEMTSTVKQSSENAQTANGLSQEAQDKAREGGEVVLTAVTAMEAINSSSKKISDIIGVIDEIAFQTNLLALNAAVEAARAGEQGRGFAVVAGEVRNLAQRSAGAAKEIKALISDSVAKVQDGRELVNASGKTLGEIVSAVEKVSVMMRDISSSAIEQTSGIEQVNTAISQMDEMTQQNAALVEQASAAAAALADQATQMNSVVSFFSIGANTAEKSFSPSKANISRPPARTIQKAMGSNSDEWEDF